MSRMPRISPVAGGPLLRGFTLTVAMLFAASGGCASKNAAVIETTPLVALSDPELQIRERARAAGRAWDLVERGDADAFSTREELKTMAWASAAPADLRIACIEALLRDTSPSGIDDSKRALGLMLMRERNAAVVTYLCEKAVELGWREMTTPMVRSYARPLRGLIFPERPEGPALLALYPGMELTEIVFRVVIDPQVEEGPYGVRFDDRARADAWELLNRLDQTGRVRSRLIASDNAQVAAARGVRIIEDLRVGLSELLVAPSTADELFWLGRLRDPNDAANLRWWEESRRVVGGLSPAQRAGMELRHVEPLRWATRHRSTWLTLDRAALVAEVASRLEGRERARRTSFGQLGPTRITERFGDAQAQMVWADLLTLLVVDDALRSPGLAEELATQVRLDHQDQTTEYGGVFELESASSDRFLLSLYPPRSRTRLGDRMFVASEDMIEASDRALAHYHLQVQRMDNRSYAGPSGGDLSYAAGSGRTCVVFTTIDDQTVNVDYYQPDGVVVDLGVIRIAQP